MLEKKIYHTIEECRKYYGEDKSDEEIEQLRDEFYSVFYRIVDDILNKLYKSPNKDR